jgi:hypothetical protein
MNWWQRLWWGDDRDHRLIKITPPPSFVSEPVNIRQPRISEQYFSDEYLEQMLNAQMRGMQGMQGQAGVMASMRMMGLSGIGSAFGKQAMPWRRR